MINLMMSINNLCLFSRFITCIDPSFAWQNVPTEFRLLKKKFVQDLQCFLVFLPLFESLFLDKVTSFLGDYSKFSVYKDSNFFFI